MDKERIPVDEEEEPDYDDHHLVAAL